MSALLALLCLWTTAVLAVDIRTPIDWRPYTCGGSFFSDSTELGCAVDRCQCWEYISECDTEYECEAFFTNDKNNVCQGRCRLSKLGIALNVFGMLLIFGCPVAVFIYHVLSVRAQSRLADMNTKPDIDQQDGNGDGLVEQEQHRHVVDRILLQRMDHSVYQSTITSPKSNIYSMIRPRTISASKSQSFVPMVDEVPYALHSDTPTTVADQLAILEEPIQEEEEESDETILSRYIDLHKLNAGGTHGAFVIRMNSQTYLETMHRFTLPVIFLVMLAIVFTSLIVALKPFQLQSTYARLQPGDLGIYLNCSVGDDECTKFEYTTLNGDTTQQQFSFYHDTLSKSPDVLRIEMHIENTGEKREPGTYVLGFYNMSLRAAGVSKPLVSNYVNKLTTTCSCMDEKCEQNVTCSSIPLVGVYTKKYGAMLYDLREQNYTIHLAFDMSSGDHKNVSFPDYSLYFEVLENPYEMTGLAIQGILGCFNIAFLVHFLAAVNRYYIRRHPAALDVPIPRRWFFHLSLERKLVAIVLLTLSVSNNPLMITLSAPFFSVPGFSYAFFRDIYETIVYVVTLGSLLTVIDAYRKDSKQFKNGASLSAVGWRFVSSKVAIAAAFLTVRLVVNLTLEASLEPTVNIDQLTSSIDLGLIVIGVATLIGVVVHVNHVLDRQRYSETRYLALNFRYITTVTYSILAVLLINLIFFSAYAEVSTFKPTNLRTSTTVSEVSISILVYMAAIAFYPPRKQERGLVPRGYVVREKRQFATTPTDLSPVAQLSSAASFEEPDNGRPRLKRTAAFRAKPISAPHRIFCIETACLMYNCSRHAYYRSSLYRETDIDEVGKPLHPRSAYVPQVALFRDNLREVVHIHDEKTDTNCIVLQSDTKIIFAFRGTASKANVKTDLEFALEELPWKSKTNPKMLAGYVHRGFYNAYLTVQQQCHDTMRQLLSEYKMRGMSADTHVQIYCTGHSLGGALATLASLDFKLTFGHRVIMYNYGSPRVGTHSFARFYNEEIPLAFRVVNEGDIVVGMLQTVSTDCFGQTKKFYKHIGTEVVMDGRVNGDFIVRPTFTEKNLIVEVRRKAARHYLLGYKQNLDAMVENVLETEKRLGELHVQTELEKALYGGVEDRYEWHADSVHDTSEAAGNGDGEYFI
ncbi:hypothetical protein AC1031_008787 [Aphanomyces cochlioides]|nr:hypothetical protein AC1031_008787 [Aphanomyces cochlioides]